MPAKPEIACPLPPENCPFAEQLASIHVKLDRLDRAIVGEPGAHNESIVLRLDRLEQANKGLMRWAWGLLSGLAFAVGAWAWALITRSGGAGARP